MDVRSARRFFPGLADKVFLDTACVGLAPVQAQQAVEAFAALAVDCPAADASSHHVAMDALRATARREGARLVGASEEEIALVESTTHGLNIAAQAIPFEPRDNVVIADLEFLQVAIPWVKLRDEGRIGEVRLARHVDGRLPPDAFAAVVDADTRAVVVSSVQWTNGYRVDLRALGELCRANGAFLVVDAVQQLGAIALDVRDADVDILVTGGHKWLNSPFGCGLMYIGRHALPRLRQASWGYLGLEEPSGGWPEYFATPSITPLRPYDFPQAAAAFEINGTSNYPGAVALGASLELINDIGVGAIEEHVVELTDALHDELSRLPVRVVTPAEHACRSGITAFEVEGDIDALLHALLDQRIYVSKRYTSHVGGIRVSTHFYNGLDDVEALVSALHRVLARPAARPRAAVS